MHFNLPWHSIKHSILPSPPDRTINIRPESPREEIIFQESSTSNIKLGAPKYQSAKPRYRVGEGENAPPLSAVYLSPGNAD